MGVMKLQNGITGFWTPGQDIPPPEIDLTRLQRLVSTLNDSGEYVLVGLADEQQSQNYVRYQFINAEGNQRFDMLVNVHYPVYCGVAENSSWMNLTFLELSEHFRSYFEPEFQYLNPQYLSTSFSQSDLSELNRTEVEQIKYWKSKTFGDIVFNGYD